MSGIDAHWERFTLRQKFARYAVYLCFMIALVLSLRSVEVIPEFFYDAPEQMQDLFSRMWPIDFKFYPISVHAAMIETLNDILIRAGGFTSKAYQEGIQMYRNQEQVALKDFHMSSVTPARRK